MKPIFRFVSFFSFILSLQTSIFGISCDTSDFYGMTTCKEVNCPFDSSITIYESGLLRRARIYFGCKDSGMFLYFSEKGDTLTKSYFKGEQTVGVFKNWHPNRKLKILSHYNNAGKKNGLYESWYENGSRRDSTVYDNGNITSLRAYYTNGKIRYWARKVDPIKSIALEAVYYDPNGKKCGEIKRGSGTFILWSEDTKSRWQITYKNGEEIASRKLNAGEEPVLK